MNHKIEEMVTTRTGCVIIGCVCGWTHMASNVHGREGARKAMREHKAAAKAAEKGTAQ